MSRPVQSATGPDLFGATLLFSLVLHGVLLLGITFDFVKPKHSLPTLDVTLVNVANRQAPDKADFLAQASNRGGGTSDRAERPSNAFSGPLPKPTPGIAPAPLEDATPAPQPPLPHRMVTTTGNSRFSVDAGSERRPMDSDPADRAAELQRRQEIAQLAAELRNRNEAYAKRPRRKYISANTREYAYAAYVRGWSDRVERVGNLNYPEEARRRQLHGELILTVGLDRDGNVISIKVIQSSGSPLLDAAAQRIVRLSAPFPPIPRDKGVDELYITRTWQFLPGDVLRNK